jgi:hypothetical protein
LGTGIGFGTTLTRGSSQRCHRVARVFAWKVLSDERTGVVLDERVRGGRSNLCPSGGFPQHCNHALLGIRAPCAGVFLARSGTYEPPVLASLARSCAYPLGTCTRFARSCAYPLGTCTRFARSCAYPLGTCTRFARSCIRESRTRASPLGACASRLDHASTSLVRTRPSLDRASTSHPCAGPSLDRERLPRGRYTPVARSCGLESRARASPNPSCRFAPPSPARPLGTRASAARSSVPVPLPRIRL